MAASPVNSSRSALAWRVTHSANIRSFPAMVAIHERFENTTIDILSTLNRLHEWEVPPDKVKYKR